MVDGCVGCVGLGIWRTVRGGWMEFMNYCLQLVWIHSSFFCRRRYRRSIREPDIFFRYLSSETGLEETGLCRQFFEMIPWRSGKWRWMPLPKWPVELQENRGRFAGFSGRTRLRRSWSLHFSFYNRCTIIGGGLMLTWSQRLSWLVTRGTGQYGFETFGVTGHKRKTM